MAEKIWKVEQPRQEGGKDFELEIPRGSLHGMLENIARNPAGVNELMGDFSLKQFHWEPKTFLSGSILDKKAIDGYRTEMVLTSQSRPEGLEQNKILSGFLKLFELLGKDGVSIGMNIVDDDQMPSGLRFDFDANGSKKTGLALGGAYALVGKLVHAALEQEVIVSKLGEKFPKPRSWSEAFNMYMQYKLKEGLEIQKGVKVGIDSIKLNDPRRENRLALALHTDFANGLGWEDFWQKKSKKNLEILGLQEYYEWDTPLASFLEVNHLSDIHAGLNVERVLLVLRVPEGRTSLEEARIRRLKWSKGNQTFGADTDKYAIASQRRKNLDLVDALDEVVLAEYHRDNPRFYLELETKLDEWIREQKLMGEDRNTLRVRYLKEVMGVIDHEVIDEYLAGEVEGDKVIEVRAKEIETEWEKRRNMVKLAENILEDPQIIREIIPKLIRGVLQSGISQEKRVSELTPQEGSKILVRLSQGIVG